MRVALFFDGKNFYTSWKDTAPDYWIDFNKMSLWIVSKVGGTHLWGAYYYTGVEAGPLANTEGQVKLAGFLDMLELQPGFFVKRFPRKPHVYVCPSCGTENRFSLEKEIDTTMVADMLRLAAVNAFDIVVLMSGDSDHAPAVEGVRAIGKQVYVATWGKSGLSPRIRRAAFDHIDLMEGIPVFGRDSYPGSADRDINSRPGSDEDWDDDNIGNEIRGNISDEDMHDVFLEELRYAQDTFKSGYVGMHYFIKRWQSSRLDNSPDRRRQILDDLVDEGQVEIYDAPDGNKAIRILGELVISDEEDDPEEVEER